MAATTPDRPSDDEDTNSTGSGPTNIGVSAEEPAEGADDAPDGDEGSPDA